MGGSCFIGISEPAGTDPFLHPGKTRRVVWNSKPMSPWSAPAHAAVACPARPANAARVRARPSITKFDGLGRIGGPAVKRATSEMERALRRDGWLRHDHRDVELSGMISMRARGTQARHQ
jgi:hypothetical protein